MYDEKHCTALALPSLCVLAIVKLASCAPQSAFLSGKWTLVTGSSRGIGLAVAEAFSREGAKVIITCEEGQKEDLQKVGPLAATHNDFFLSVNRFFCGMPVWLQVLLLSQPRFVQHFAILYRLRSRVRSMEQLRSNQLLLT